MEFCAKDNMPLLPGVMTPCDVALCQKYGFKVMKLFPAGSMPYKYIADLKGPFDDTEYIAVGGVKRENINAFFSAGYLGVGMSGGLIPRQIIEQCEWKAGTHYIRKIVEEMQKAKKG